MELKILPSNIANMIAAGEVVQRPSSVVKELMENAMDAGASQVTVVIADAGRTLIQVIDNGCGMDPDEAVLCFERHATSKIATAEDLADISTYGFRGEALSSIAAVSEVTLRTRKEGESLGCEVVFADSKHVSTSETACPAGSNFSVRNLFYNVPARRKFLKSDNVEFKHIVEEFTRVALTRPEAGFTLIHNGRDIYVLKPAKSLKFRITDLLGAGVVGEVVDVAADTSVVNLRGFVGRPDTAKKTLGNQFFFVNGRYFRSAYMHKAVMKAYEDLIPEGVTPSYFLYLEVDPKSMDVNIHPTKTEIKFEDDSVIFQVIFACVKESLGRNSGAGTIDFDSPRSGEMPVFSSRFEDFHPVATPAPDTDPSYNPFVGEGVQGQMDFSGHDWNSGAYKTGNLVDRKQDYGRLFEEKSLPLSRIIILQGKYLVTPGKEGLTVVNIRRARERILYERFLGVLSKEGHITQVSLFPVTVQVGVENRLVFDAHGEELRKLGFDITPFGNDTVVVNGVPEGFSNEAGKVQTMVGDLLLILSDDSADLPGVLESKKAQAFATLGAASGEDLSSPVEAQRLLDALFSCDNAEFTTGGRRIITRIPISDIDKKF